MRRYSVAGLLPAFALIAGIVGADAPPEMRACWVSRFEWPGGSEATVKARITNIMQTLKNHNFNAVLFQVRGEMDTLYPSPEEPWASQFGWTDPGWDPVQFAIEQAHANGLEFHAYINTHTVAAVIPPANTTPQHPYNLHGPGAEESWVIHNESGTPMGVVDSYVWRSPGVPNAEAWTRRQIMYIVENYDVDGIHFDRIRTPGPGYSHDPVSVARFNGDGNPDNLEWGDFMRSQITRELRNIYGATMLRKPHVKISSAPFGICRRVPGGYQGNGTQSYFSWNQDSFGWMEAHVMDCLFPQIYWDIGSAHPYEVLLKDFLDRDGGRHIYPGSTSSRDYIAQVYNSRSQGALGQTVFSYGSIDFSAYLNGPYAEPAPIPEMPWKTNPTTGIIVGHVRDLDGQPVVDSKINRTDDTYNYLSSGDGFFSILDVPPGTVTVTAVKNGVGRATRTLTINAGDVLDINLVLSNSQGTIELDRDSYRSGDEMIVTVRDGDLGTTATVTVEATSDTETVPEVISLGMVSSGVYQATIPVTFGAMLADGKMQVRGGDEIRVVYEDAFDGSGPATVQDTATADPYAIIYREPMDTDPGWTTEGQWAWGVPTGQGGTHGGKDPASGYTGANVYGYNLNGGYANEMAAPRYLTTGPIDCSGGTDTRLSFWRWLLVEGNQYDKAAFELSTDNGDTWTTLWENGAATLNESAWSQQKFDIPQADGKAEVRLRWGIGPTDEGWTYGGWNIDDLEVEQIPKDPGSAGWMVY